jgi:hypothetical protein
MSIKYTLVYEYITLWNLLLFSNLYYFSTKYKYRLICYQWIKLSKKKVYRYIYKITHVFIKMFLQNYTDSSNKLEIFIIYSKTLKIKNCYLTSEKSGFEPPGVKHNI